MAIPIRDVNPTRRYPVLTKALVFVNIAVFVMELADPRLADRYAFVPALAFEQPARWITHMFLHGGVLHLVGNMIYLWVFGDNVEDRLGRLKFLAAYLLWGVAAAFVHYISVLVQYEATGYRPLLAVPAVGASGAISGILGAYLVLFPRARILTLTLFAVITLVEVPAWAFIGFWFIYQLFQGSIELLSLKLSGVAYWAHIGGFIAGAITAIPFRGSTRRYIVYP